MIFHICRRHNYNKDFAFLGYFSRFYLYLNITDIFLRIDGYSRKHKVEGEFIVMSSNQIFVEKTNLDCCHGKFGIWSEKYDCCHTTRVPIVVYQVRKQSLQVYYFQVERTRQVVVQIKPQQSIKYLFYDGPVIFENPMSNHSVQTCSTFQCVLCILAQNHKYSKRNKTLEFVCHSQALGYSENVLVTEYSTIHKLPNERCFDNTCILSISTLEHKTQVNITVSRMIITKIFDPKCIFTGLAIQSETLCDSHNSTQGPSRSFYSTNSTLTLAFYWYKGQSSIRAKTVLSSTKCAPILINTCNFTLKCKIFDLCNSFTNNLQELSKIQVHWTKRKMHFTQMESGCVVLVLFYPAKSRTTHCEFEVEFAPG